MEQYEKICEIGKGSFGQVSKIKRKSDGKTLVWKEMNYGRMSDKEKQLLVSEVNILRELDHPNIVKYYERILNKEKQIILIVMEYCDKGDMALMIRKLKRDRDYLPEQQIWKILAQIIYGLFACHRRKEGNKILHRDLKPGNILFDAQGNAKLADFGLSRMMGDQSQFAYTHVGTPYYMSPEQISEQKYNEKSDIWSAACVIYELAALKTPFEATNQIQLAMKIKEGKINRIPQQYSDELFRVIQQMMTQNFEKRPSVDDLMMHPQISKNIKENFIKDKISSVKREEEKIMSNEKYVKQKEQEILEKLRELEEEEKRLDNWERQLQERAAKLNSQVIIEASNKISIDKLSFPFKPIQTPKNMSNQLLNFNENPPATGQIRRFQKCVSAERQQQSEDAFMNENKQKIERIQAAKQYIKKKQIEESRSSNNLLFIPTNNDNQIINNGPNTHRRLVTQRDDVTIFKKPPMLVRPGIQKTERTVPDLKQRPQQERIQDKPEQISEIEIQRRKLADLRANYKANSGNNSRQNSFDKNIAPTGLPSPCQNIQKLANQTMGTFDFKRVMNVQTQRNSSQEKQSAMLQFMNRRPSTHSGNSSNQVPRQAMGDVTSQLNNYQN
ncbi:serine threonine-protein kinase nek2 [Stylonychia lemnae]|uniref:non-specific serine/threonine protein kinase n=1 Tax=Stylonychia lemnae TaxID=5949 RepID=A0A077ZMV8_STYLE|nr:serine threonine-protein kinase nek2 [Stylonychia lemnae]|eukprot:CDW71297.1 serine threonine-protein kinase nek2 [Stylonychia lemnae]